MSNSELIRLKIIRLQRDLEALQRQPNRQLSDELILERRLESAKEDLSDSLAWLGDEEQRAEQFRLVFAVPVQRAAFSSPEEYRVDQFLDGARQAASDLGCIVVEADFDPRRAPDDVMLEALGLQDTTIDAILAISEGIRARVKRGQTMLILNKASKMGFALEGCLRTALDVQSLNLLAVFADTEIEQLYETLEGPRRPFYHSVHWM